MGRVSATGQSTRKWRVSGGRHRSKLQHLSVLRSAKSTIRGVEPQQRMTRTRVNGCKLLEFEWLPVALLDQESPGSPRRGNGRRNSVGLFLWGARPEAARLRQFRGPASCTLKNQPSGCCAPAKDQNVADLAENDLGGEDLSENKKRADQDDRSRSAYSAAGSHQRNCEGGRPDEKREHCRTDGGEYRSREHALE